MSAPQADAAAQAHRRHGARELAWSIGLAAMLFAGAAHSEVEVLGFLAMRATGTDSPRSWTDGGLGRFQEGTGIDLGVESRVQIEASSDSGWLARLQLGLRAEESGIGNYVGVIEAFVERSWWVDRQRWKLRVGQSFLPTSRENIDPLWASPYTLTHSAINSWIGEEFRPIGADLSWRLDLSPESDLELAASAFVGNDSSGALLAWRGFAWNNRPSFYGETLPLPELASLSDPFIFADQDDAGSTPFGRDLDGRPGYATRVRWTNGQQRWLLSAVDTRGDMALHRGEYAWHTQFLLAGFDHNANELGWGFAAEALVGDTRMGVPGLPKAHIKFQSAYLLASYANDLWRYSVRVEGFNTDDIDQTIAENNKENGWGLTLAVLRQVGAWRLGTEYLYVNGVRPGAADEGFDRQIGGQQLRFETRYLF